jgi:siderophore synthetase component
MQGVPEARELEVMGDAMTTTHEEFVENWRLAEAAARPQTVPKGASLKERFERMYLDRGETPEAAARMAEVAASGVVGLKG